MTNDVLCCYKTNWPMNRLTPPSPKYVLCNNDSRRYSSNKAFWSQINFENTYTTPPPE